MFLFLLPCLCPRKYEYQGGVDVDVDAGGVDVVEIGLCSTDGLYFASGHLGLPGAMFTASHNPAQYNGVKFCLADAAPIQPAMLTEIARLAMGPALPATERPGTRREQDVLSEYAAHLHALVPLDGMRRLKVVYVRGLLG